MFGTQDYLGLGLFIITGIIFAVGMCTGALLLKLIQMFLL